MKTGLHKLFTVVVALSIVSGISFTADVRASDDTGRVRSVTVFSYNIRHGEGLDGVVNLQRTADVIRQSGADIVALQEVDSHYSSRSDYKDDAKELAELLGMNYAFGANLDLPPETGRSERRQYGTAVLSKYPILESHNHPLPKVEQSSEARGSLETIIDVDGTSVTVYSNHLSIIAGERVLQVRALVKLAEGKAGPKIFMGDFNAKPNTFEMRPIFKQYNEAFNGKKNAFTAPADKPVNKIDYIFFDESFEATGCDIIQSEASDHLPVAARLQFK